jgi:hypothetical protein
VRRELWPASILSMSPKDHDMVQIPRALFAHLTDTLAYAD